jgi:tetratricopeptide (TPR) repeat protein
MQLIGPMWSDYKLLSLAAQMSGVRKARLHTQIAGSLEKEQATIDQLAHHLLQGAASGDPVLAATSALAAAEEAAKLHDHGSAIDLIERGLAALERADDDQLRARLMVTLAQERKHKEHYTQSHAAAQEGFRLAKRAGDIDLMVAAALAFCGQGSDDNRFGISWLGYWNPPGPALDMLGQCLEKLESGPQRVVVLIAYASQLFGEYDNPSEAAIILEEALADARESHHQELLAAALSQEIFTLQRHMPYARRKANIEEAVTLAESMGTPVRIIAANRALTILRLDEDDIAGARDTVTACDRALAGREEPSLSLFVESMSIALDLYQGRLSQTEQNIQQAMARYERIGSAALDLLGIQYATLLREQGKLEEVENLMRWKVSGYPGPAYGVALAMVLAEQGKTGEAVDALGEYANEGIESGGEGVLQFMTTSFYAETIMALGAIERARRLYPALAGAAKRTVAMYSGIVILGSGSLYLGRLATLLGRFDEATEHLVAARHHHQAVGARPYELRTLLAQIDLARASGLDGDVSVDELVVTAHQLGNSLGMEWLTTARLG